MSCHADQFTASRFVRSKPGLYAISPDEADDERLLARCEQVLKAGVTLLQYRNKTAATATRLRQARALQALCCDHGVPLIINDDWRLAADIGAAGVHLGEADGELASVRAALGDAAILGASCYNRLDLAQQAAANGASYVAFGAFYPSTTKPGARQATLDILRDAAALGLPRVAIGGIRPDNVAPLRAAGADWIAVISGIFDAADPAAAVRDYLHGFDL